MAIPKKTIFTYATENIASHYVILDVDGTLVSDASEHISDEVFRYIKNLKLSHTIYICSNGDTKRTERIARMLDVSVLSIRKPYDTVPTELNIHTSKGITVIGDKYLTDGIFAHKIHAHFLKVDHVRSNSDSFLVKVSYVIDDVFWFGFNVLKLMRPFQWIKNLLVFTPLFFAGEVLGDKFFAVLGASAIFSLSASFVYVLNDRFDVLQDKQHATKKYRPLASGAISFQQSYFILASLFFSIVYLLSFIPVLIIPIIVYIILNILYSSALKHVAVLDVVLVSTFYIIRVVAGGLVAQVFVSPWILLCVFFGALFIVLGKRRSEYTREIRRKVLNQYGEKALDHMFSISAAIAIITYGIYTVIGHPSLYLVYSNFFIVVALFQILNRIYTHPEQVEYPEILVFKDFVVFGAFIGWVIYVFFVFYIF